MSRQRKRIEQWGRLNFAVNLVRLASEIVRWFWHIKP